MVHGHVERHQHGSVWAQRAHRAYRLATHAGKAFQVGKVLKNTWEYHRSHTKPHKKAAMVPLSENLRSDIHSGTSVSMMRVHCKKPLKGVIGRPFFLHDVRSTLLTAATGQQGAANVFYSATPSQWSTATSGTLASIGATQSEVAYFDMNPYAKITGSGQFAAGLTSVDRLVFKSEELILDVSNFGSNGCTVYLCFMLCTKFTDKDPVSLWGDGLSSNADGVFGQTVPGPGQAFPSASGAGSTNTVYETPYHHEIVKKHWRVVGKRMVQLAGAASEKVKVHIAHNNLGRKEVLSENGRTYAPGTVTLLAIVYGTPVLDVTGGAQIPTYGQCKLGFIMNSRKCFMSYKANAARIETELSSNMVPANATLVNQRQVNNVDVVAGEVQA